MTTVRGKDPLKLTDSPHVEAEVYGMRVIITSGGWAGDGE